MMKTKNFYQQLPVYFYFLLITVNTLVGCKKNTDISPADSSGSLSDDAKTRAISTSPLKIAFQSTRDGGCQPYKGCNFEIYTMNGDGSGVTRLTNNPASDEIPVWSPDGTRIVFSSFRDPAGSFGTQSGNRDIYVMNADGSNVKRLTNDPGLDIGASWSPDGSKIAFISDRYVAAYGTRVYGIYIMNADGSNVVMPTRPFWDGGAAWSPDGKKIAFSSAARHSEEQVYPHTEIYVMNVDGSGITRLTTNGASDDVVSWSPDGKQIGFYSSRDGDQGIFVMNADGSSPKRIGTGSGPRWTYNWKYITFQKAGDSQLYIMNADGSGVRRITNDPENFYNQFAFPWAP